MTIDNSDPIPTPFSPHPPSGDFPFTGEEFRYYQIVFVGARLLGASLLTALFP